MSDISKSYPFLSISKKYNIEYGDVLKVAEVYRLGDKRGARIIETRLATPNGERLLGDIKGAVSHFKSVQSGVAPFPPT